MNLPTEIRYRPYDEWTEEDKENILKNVSKSPWRATYHLEAKTGLLNDPNG
ncbi:TPA: sucrose-6-phosphate hydrolase, partial [Streptococcus agalactiae]